jgi:hypothetical protein
LPSHPYVPLDWVTESMVRQEIPFLSNFSKNMKNIIENVGSSYEWSIQSIEAILDTTHQLFEGFQDSFLDTKQEREKINGELRESLAKNESLRRKDFDNMMQGILSTQDEREKEVRNLLKTYLNEQKEIAWALRENLEKFKDSIAVGEVQRVKEFQVMIKEILAKQEERKNKVTSRLKEFQKEQQEMAKRFKELLAKGSELRIKDLKSMLKEFRARYKERVVHQEERKGKVHTLLGEFKKERIEAARSCRTVQKKVQRRTNSSKAIKVGA